MASADASPPLASEGRWHCLETSAARAVALLETVVLSLTIREATSERGLADVAVRACNRIDITCQTPLVEARSDARGVLELDLAQGFDGFLEIERSGSLPTLFFFGQPLMANGREELVLLGPSAFEALAFGAGARLEPGRGHVLVRAHDCEGARAARVQVTMSSEAGEAFAFEDGLPHLGASVTGKEGVAGFLNVPPGLLVLSAEEVGGKHSLGRRSVWLRPDGFTYVDFEPERW